MKVFISVLTAFLVSSPVFAHEGHGHEGMPEAPHGGVIKEGKTLNLELTAQGAEIAIYPLSKDGKALKASDVVLTASAQAPKKSKSMVSLKLEGDHFKGTVKDAGSYRYELQTEVTYKGKKESIKFQVEP